MAKQSATYVKSRKKEKSPIRGLLPIMGLALAVLLGVVSYFLAPAIVNWAEKDDGRIGDVVRNQIEAQIPADWPEHTLEYGLAVVLWLIFFGVSMTVVAAAIGPDPDKLATKDMPVSPANKKALIKQMKKDLKEAQRRERERNRRR